MRFHPRFVPSTLACALGVAFQAPVLAQTSPAPVVLPPVVVTGNPLASDTPAAPVSVLTGDELTRRRASTLGETLKGLPGVSSTDFGPHASRPVIRGLDGDRVRILGNGGASVDASSLSFDHAVPIDPLAVERIEVLRGPGALMYGGSAVGGVVNTLDNRIPQDRIDGPSGMAELRLGGAELERGAGALIETGNGQLALHVDVFGRKTSDLRVPRHVPVEDGMPLDATRRVRNSAGEAQGGAVGGSVFFDHGHIGAAIDTYDSRYGIVAEPDVTVHMKREQLRLGSALKRLDGPVRALKFQLNSSRYQHREVEGSGEVGTTFKSDGSELRIEAEHAPVAGLRGVLGLHVEGSNFSALGEEAFVPNTRTQKRALFAVEALPWAGGVVSAGLRFEQAQVDSRGDADPAESQFGPAMQRRFSLRSASLSNVTQLSPQWSATGAFSLTERAPTAFELYANGVHAATGVYERGDTTLGKERGGNLDVALQWKDGNNHLRLGAYAARFSRFISLEATGVDEIVEGEAVPLYVFRPVRAHLHGIEVEGKQRLLSAPLALDLSGKLDLTRSKNADTGEALPRVAPLRVSLGLDATQGPWSGRIEADHAAAQHRVPATDRATAGHTLVHLSLSRRIDGGAFWFVKLSNLGNELAYSASSTQSIRALVPLPGRALKAGLRVAF